MRHTKERIMSVLELANRTAAVSLEVDGSQKNRKRMRALYVARWRDLMEGWLEEVAYMPQGGSQSGMAEIVDGAKALQELKP